MAFLLIVSGSYAAPIKVAHAVTVLVTENSYELCHDGIDNDENLLTDMSDESCNNYANPPATPENTLELCTDGIDNDQDLKIDFSDEDCGSFTNPTATSTPENTVELCGDGIDNDLDLKIDMSDEDCAPFVTPVATSTPENTQVLCSDGIDNDQDLLTDLSDEDCVAFINPATTTPSTSTDTTGNPTTSGPTGGGGITSFLVATSSQTVLGASTERPLDRCDLVLNEYFRLGNNNSVAEVKKLQEALNILTGSTLEINGKFGIETDVAVRNLQQQQSAHILMPWVNLNLMDSPVPTGYVYKTTRWYINNTLCSTLNAPAPMLP